jgi:hypothetical protein
MPMTLCQHSGPAVAGSSEAMGTGSSRTATTASSTDSPDARALAQGIAVLALLASVAVIWRSPGQATGAVSRTSARIRECR